MKKKLIIAFSVILFVLVGMVVYVKAGMPRANFDPAVSIDLTSADIEHGKYLANHVAACVDCHSKRDWSKFSGPIVPGTVGGGGEYFGPEMGFPGEFYSKNLTPFHLGDWTDAEIFRAITCGVSKDGKALFPVMPYLYYGKMPKEDVVDIIAYLRRLEPVEHATPPSKPDFPMNFIINTIPKNPKFEEKPDPSDKLAYGRYLVNAAACMECHTPVKNGQVIVENVFWGGRPFEMPNGILRSPNLTPDRATGIGTWSEEMFIKRFKAYEDLSSLPSISEEDYNTLMPWSMYAGMKNEDLAAIYTYLKSLEPKTNLIEKFSPNKKAVASAEN